MLMGSCQKEGQGQNLSPCSETAAGMKYCCSNCKTTKTPMWRTGPSGPKSLCNACGIRYRKNRPVAAAAVGAKNDVDKGKIEKKKEYDGERCDDDDDEEEEEERAKPKAME